MRIIHIVAFILAVSLSVCSATGKAGFVTLYNLAGGNPVGLTAANGVLYGAAEAAGINCGLIYELQPPSTPGAPWTEILLHSFTGTGDACEPIAAPIVGPNGALYGVTSSGGAYDYGAVYELQPPSTPGAPWTETVLYSFFVGSPGIGPSSLLIDSNGSLYVTTTGSGANGAGTLFELQPPTISGGVWTGTVLYNFPSSLSAGGAPASLTLGSNGVFYGTTILGGTALAQAGTVFQLTPPASSGEPWTETLLYSFQGGTDGSTPNSVIIADHGALYGTTFGTTYIGQYVGPRGVGTVFQLTPPATPGGAWTKTILQQFGQGNFCGPNSPLIMRSGNLYGSSCVSPGGGVVFELAPPATPGSAWTTTYFHRFTNAEPLGELVMDRKGTIFGVTIPPVSQQPAGTIYAVTTQ